MLDAGDAGARPSTSLYSPTEAPGLTKVDSSAMSLRGRIGAFRLHATHDPRETARAARVVFLKRFEQEVDPEFTLSAAERDRRAMAARKAYFAKLAYRSAVTRADKRREQEASSEE